MELLTFVSDLFEVIAALAALGVTYLMYREAKKNTDDSDKS
jgi:hypothetical protein